MIAGKQPRKGHPLLALAVILMAWGGVRAVTWHSPFPLPDANAITRAVGPLFAEAAPPPSDRMSKSQEAQSDTLSRVASADLASPLLRPVGGNIGRLANVPMEANASLFSSRPAPGVMTAHSALLMAGFAHLPVPVALEAMVNRASSGSTIPRPAVPTAKGGNGGKAGRWSGDGWLFWRGNGPSAANAAPGASRLAGSQAGAVIRYDLLPDAALRPQVYLRAAAAMQRPAEPSAALGVAVRPLRAVAMTLHAEARVNQTANGITASPAGFAVVQLPTQPLAAGLRANAYAQAGYVGGDFATGFVDGQARIERSLAQFDLADISAGAGVWGGAQRGAERVDVGPTIAADMRKADPPVRLSVDYRIKVAGNADPGSGVAVTLSSGF